MLFSSIGSLGPGAIGKSPENMNPALRQESAQGMCAKFEQGQPVPGPVR